ncbi:MAG: hypothetical protein ABW220_09170 [Burkholderiaceae bacterium]
MALGLTPFRHRRTRLMEGLGYPAFVSVLVVCYLMVNKPLLWG